MRLVVAWCAGLWLVASTARASLTRTPDVAGAGKIVSLAVDPLLDQTVIWTAQHHHPSNGQVDVDDVEDSRERKYTKQPMQVEEDLLSWANRLRKEGPSVAEEEDANKSDSAISLVVGIKTSVVHNFKTRQAIRETWARHDGARARGVKFVFLGCQPDLSTFTNAAEWQSAIAMEKHTYHDLLTDELACQDSYYQLVQKTLAFMHWVTTLLLPKAPSLTYVMVTDDDVFLHVERLLDLLNAPATPKTRYYAGSVWTASLPIRDATHKNYISTEEYPMSQLPPFAAGPQYVVSLDVAQFLARNIDDLRGLRSLDDVSIALWLLTMQVHAVHIAAFGMLRDRPCRDDLVALADLSPASIRHLHQNVVHNRSLCDQLPSTTGAMRTYRTIILPDVHTEDDDVVDNSLVYPKDSGRDESGNAFFSWDMQHDVSTNAIQIVTTIAVDGQAVSFTYAPSFTTHYDGFCVRALALVHEKLFVGVDTSFCELHRRAFRHFLGKAVRDSPNLRPFLALPRHNVERQGVYDDTTRSQPFVVVLSRGAKHARVLVECLFVEMYPENDILVIHEDRLHLHMESTLSARTPARVAVVVFSILDAGEPNRGAPASWRRDAAAFAELFGSSAQLIMISGEAWPVAKLDPNVILLSTVDTPHHIKQLYLPVGSSAFAESMQHSPLELLRVYQPTTHQDGGSTRRFCAYLYARCDRPMREYMFDLLNEAVPVDALGACQGTTKPPQRERLHKRYHSPFYTDDAIDLYTGYKFVIAFENTLDAPGYVTEKIVTAFLAGSVPVYYGHSKSATHLFNPRAFIDCGDFDSLRKCAERVIAVHKSPELYSFMKSEPPIVNASAFEQAFSWHPDVVDRMAGSAESRLAERLKGLMTE